MCLPFHLEYSAKDDTFPPARICELTMLLHDERNGLERVLLHFSHFEKETLHLDDHLYQIKLLYDKNDETELLIRVLSFGPILEVVAPSSFVSLIQDRLQKQSQMHTANFKNG